MNEMKQNKERRDHGGRLWPSSSFWKYRKGLPATDTVNVVSKTTPPTLFSPSTSQSMSSQASVWLCENEEFRTGPDKSGKALDNTLATTIQAISHRKKIRVLFPKQIPFHNYKRIVTAYFNIIISYSLIFKFILYINWEQHFFYKHNLLLEVYRRY